MTDTRSCCLCGWAGAGCDVPTAAVRSNVRRFANKRFVLWRCPRCRSLHAAEPADLNEIYRDYPFANQRADWALWCAHHTLLRRLRRAGIRPGDRVLDFGCGSGLLVDFLRAHGYRAEGYDPYATRHADRRVLARSFRAVLAQDVVEHDEDPREVFRQLDDVLQPGGVALVGTPCADGIDLDDPERFVHPLHQPFHRHIFSRTALEASAREVGWSLENVLTTPYTNMPLLSLPLMHHVMGRADGTLESLFDRRPDPGFWLSPKTWYLLAAGYFLCNDADVQAVFRKREAKRAMDGKPDRTRQKLG